MPEDLGAIRINIRILLCVKNGLKELGSFFFLMFRGIRIQNIQGKKNFQILLRVFYFFFFF